MLEKNSQTQLISGHILITSLLVHTIQNDSPNQLIWYDKVNVGIMNISIIRYLRITYSYAENRTQNS
jgi:hypothetical protein